MCEPVPSMVASPKIVAEIVLRQTTTTTLPCRLNGVSGPCSWYSSTPAAFPAPSALALPPKFARSLLSVTIQPPLVILTSQSGVLAGNTHVFVATSEGSGGGPGCCTQLLFVSAKALIASWPGCAGLVWVRLRWPF